MVAVLVKVILKLTELRPKQTLSLCFSTVVKRLKFLERKMRCHLVVMSSMSAMRVTKTFIDLCGE